MHPATAIAGGVVYKLLSYSGVSTKLSLSKDILGDLDILMNLRIWGTGFVLNSLFELDRISLMRIKHFLRSTILNISDGTYCIVCIS